MRSFIAFAVVTSSSLASLAACGGGAPAPAVTPPPAATPSSAAEVAAPAPPWSDAWSMDQKVAFMKTNVGPKMAALFQGVDAKKYADFGCQTCHGPDKKPAKDFLPHLTMKGGKLTCFADKPELSKFMAEKVSPTMADTLGLPHFNPETHEGFGCGGCHTIDVQK
jgi:hypothetical protein